MGRVNITFGMIVLNGEPFLRYNLRALYPFAHQIIVVEGAVPDAGNTANSNGHSTDSTLDVLRHFKTNEDPANKLSIITAEDEGHPNGFWPGEKDEQSRAYAKRAAGNYLWQVDSDEFYKPEDMQTIISMLDQDPQITAVSFPMITFWGGMEYWVDGWYLRRGASTYHRLFKWGPGYQYLTHRPPTVLDDEGRDTRRIHWIRGGQLAKMGVFLYHYSLLLPQQVEEKVTYYENAGWSKRAGASEWMRNSFRTLGKPYRVHNVFTFPSWLERFHGTHPPEAVAMYGDILNGDHPVKLRRTDDIERLLSNPLYLAGKKGLIMLDYLDRLRIWILSPVKFILRKPYRWVRSFWAGKA